jgi:HEAT repeat protein
MEILQSTNSVERKLDAVIVLGEYRAVEAVPILVDHLEWDEATVGEVTRILPQEEVEELWGPVTMALQKIGVAAVPPLLERISATDNPKLTWKCTWICSRVEGPAVTRFRLQGLLEKETDVKRKGRIEAALEALKKIAPGK